MWLTDVNQHCFTMLCLSHYQCIFPQAIFNINCVFICFISVWQACLDLMNKCITDMNQRSDKQYFLELHNQQFNLPKKFEFQAHKGDEVGCLWVLKRGGEGALKLSVSSLWSCRIDLITQKHILCILCLGWFAPMCHPCILGAFMCSCCQINGEFSWQPLWQPHKTHKCIALSGLHAKITFIS